MSQIPDSAEEPKHDSVTFDPVTLCPHSLSPVFHTAA